MFERDESEARRDARAEVRERADRLHAGDWVTGRLIEHGKAPFRFEQENLPSYFVRLQSASGQQVVWGVDLERAIKQSKSKAKAGDAVGVRITTREKLDSGKTLNRWQVDTAIFIVQQRRTAREILDNPVTARQRGKEHPELVGNYLLVRAAELLAKTRYPNPEDRQRFIDKVRAAAVFVPGPLEPQPIAAVASISADSVHRTPLSDSHREPRRAGWARE